MLKMSYRKNSKHSIIHYYYSMLAKNAMSYPKREPSALNTTIKQYAQEVLALAVAARYCLEQ